MHTHRQEIRQVAKHEGADKKERRLTENHRPTDVPVEHAWLSEMGFEG